MSLIKNKKIIDKSVYFEPNLICSVGIFGIYKLDSPSLYIRHVQVTRHLLGRL